MIAKGRLEKFARTLPTVNNISLQVIILDELVIFIFTIFIIIQFWNQRSPAFLRCDFIKK